jgi:hypothetical protein
VGNDVATGVPTAAGTDDVSADGDAAALGSIDGVRLAGGALAGALGSGEGGPPGDEAGGWVPGAVAGVGDAGAVVAGTTATGPLERSVPASCCWSRTPPIPKAIVASTRFRTPRLRMSRTR